MKDKQNIAKLAECCVKGNANVLNQAAGVAVFLADSGMLLLLVSHVRSSEIR